MKQIKNRGWLLFSITSSLFFAFQIAGFALSKTPLLSWTFPFWLIIIFGSIIPGFSLGIFVAWLLERTKDKREEAVFAKYEDGWLVEGYRNLGEHVKDPLPPSSIAWLIILVSYVPGFLAFYPGICSYDSFIQLYQCVSGTFNDHHPILHTLLIYTFWDYGRELGNVTTGIAMFTAFQMICLSGAFAYCISLIKKMGCRKLWYWVLTAFAALFPYNMYMALTLTKAGLFTAAFLPTLVLLLFFFRKKRCSLVPEKEDIIYTAFLVPTIAFMNNARYAIFALAAILLVVMIVLAVRKNYDFLICLRILISTTIGTVAALLLISGAAKVLDFTQGDRREMLSIPVQQMSRAVVNHLDEMEPRDMEIVDSFILEEGWRDYDPVISDPVKRNVNTWFALHYPGQTLKTYLRLFVKYPSDYIDAFLAQNAGYLYIFDQSCVDAGGGLPGYGFIQTGWAEPIYTSGVVKSSMLPGYEAFLEKIASGNILQKIPVVGILFVPGYVLWAFVLFAVACWYKKRYYLIIPIALALAFIGTLLLGPTVQLRFIYPVWVFLPFLTASIFRGKKR